MANVLVTRMIPPPAVELLRQAGHDVTVHEHDRLYTRGELLEAVKGRHGILPQLGDVIDAAVMDAAGGQLKVISNFAVGYNNIDVPAATRRGIAVCNTPGVLTDATADIAWVLLMGVARRVSEGDRMVRTGGFTGWTPRMMLGSDIKGGTLAIIGAGRIGYAVAKRAKAWEMRIIYTARSAHEDFERDFAAVRMELDDALREADFVSIHVPLTDDTRHMIDERRLKLMKRTAYLVNTSRGPVVDEKALVRALKEGWIAGAGLDVYEREPQVEPGLTDCDNTLLLPHLGSATVQTRAKMSELAARNLIEVLAGRKPPHQVNAAG